MLPAAAIHGIVPCVASTLPVYLLATVYRQTNNVDEHLSFQLVQDSVNVQVCDATMFNSSNTDWSIIKKH
jgi:hypothetical protein